MRFGLAIMNDYPPGSDIARRIAQLREQVAAARDAGIDSVWVLQHYLGNMPTLQPVPLLGAIAADSAPMAIGTNMFILPLRHPVAVAEEFATLDQLTGGRVIAGFGLGYRDVEFDAFGVRQDERVARFTEGVEVIRALWRDEPVHYAGRHVTLDGARISLPPAQPGGPPVWVGAGAHRAGARRAARLGDAWLVPPHVADDRLHRVIASYREERAQAGLDGGAVVLRRECLLRADASKAFELGVRARGALSAAYGEFNAPDQTEVYRHLSGTDGAARTAAEAYLFTDPETCVKELRALEGAGVETVVLRMQWYDLPQAEVLRTLEVFRREVAPHFAAARPGG